MAYIQKNNPLKKVKVINSAEFYGDTPEVLAAKNDPMFSEKYSSRNEFINPTKRIGLDRMIINETDPDIIARMLNERRRYEDEYNTEDVGARRNFKDDRAFVDYLKRTDQEDRLRERFGEQWERVRDLINNDERSGRDLGEFEKFRIKSVKY